MKVTLTPLLAALLATIMLFAAFLLFSCNDKSISSANSNDGKLLNVAPVTVAKPRWKAKVGPADEAGKFRIEVVGTVAVREGTTPRLSRRSRQMGELVLDLDPAPAAGGEAKPVSYEERISRRLRYRKVTIMSGAKEVATIMAIEQAR